MNTTEREIALIKDLLSLPAETDWVEFKENNSDPTMIGKKVSALANAARISDKHFAYVVWGIEDTTHRVVGTNFEPTANLVKREPLEFWLAKRFQPSVEIRFRSLKYEEKNIVLLEIPAAVLTPIEFDRTAYIRIGSATPRLSDHPDRQRKIWAKLQPFAWEKGCAKQFVSGDDVLSLLDYSKFFDLTAQPLPDNRDGIFERLLVDNLIEEDAGGKWNITNLGAILFAKNLGEFGSSILRKGVRFVRYDGNSRSDTVINRYDGQRGYAVAFESLVVYINSMNPKIESIGDALRKHTEAFPKTAIRELVANALIHQDLTMTGAGPNIEVFKNRIEFTNPGEPLNPPERFIDYPPKSRNETIATLMRRMQICEEQGTGIDKVVKAAETAILPPPDFRTEGGMTRAILYGPRSYSNMTPEERVRACYQHAILKYIDGERMKNATLRERLGVEVQNSAQISMVLRHAVNQNKIKPIDPDKPRSGYIPYWA